MVWKPKATRIGSLLYSWVLFVSLTSCTIQKAGKLGGDGGEENYFDDVETALTPTCSNISLQSISMYEFCDNPSPIQGIQGSYNVCNMVISGQFARTFKPFEGSGCIILREFIEVSVPATDSLVLTEMYGYYQARALTPGQSPLYLVNSVGFTTARRINGEEEGGRSCENSLIQSSTISRSLGIQTGIRVSILGPIVGLWGTYGDAIDSIGAYIDVSLWPERPSRLVYVGTAGRNYGQGNEVAFDHNQQLSKPFAVRIAAITVYHSTLQNVITGLKVVYEDNVKNMTTIETGSLTGDGVEGRVVQLSSGDTILELEIDDHNGNPASDFQCISFVRFHVLKANGKMAIYSVGSIPEGQDSLSLKGPVVALHGVLHMRQGSGFCIPRLGAYRLLEHTELPRACVLPNLSNASISGSKDCLAAGDTVTLSCPKPNFVAVSGSELTCREDGLWDGDELQCREGPLQSSSYCFVPVVAAAAAALTLVCLGLVVLVVCAVLLFRLRKRRVACVGDTPYYDYARLGQVTNISLMPNPSYNTSVAKECTESADIDHYDSVGDGHSYDRLHSHFAHPTPLTPPTCNVSSTPGSYQCLCTMGKHGPHCTNSAAAAVYYNTPIASFQHDSQKCSQPESASRYPVVLFAKSSNKDSVLNLYN